jgi:hypothetical protein
MLMEMLINRPQLKLFCCEHCGTVNISNFRDDCCPVCKVCMKVTMLTIEVVSIKAEPAPHVD